MTNYEQQQQVLWCISLLKSGRFKLILIRLTHLLSVCVVFWVIMLKKQAHLFWNAIFDFSIDIHNLVLVLCFWGIQYTAIQKAKTGSFATLLFAVYQCFKQLPIAHKLGFANINMDLIDLQHSWDNSFLFWGKLAQRLRSIPFTSTVFYTQIMIMYVCLITVPWLVLVWGICHFAWLWFVQMDMKHTLALEQCFLTQWKRDFTGTKFISIPEYKQFKSLMEQVNAQPKISYRVPAEIEKEILDSMGTHVSLSYKMVYDLRSRNFLLLCTTLDTKTCFQCKTLNSSFTICQARACYNKAHKSHTVFLVVMKPEHVFSEWTRLGQNNINIQICPLTYLFIFGCKIMDILSWNEYLPLMLRQVWPLRTPLEEYTHFFEPNKHFTILPHEFLTEPKWMSSARNIGRAVTGGMLETSSAPHPPTVLVHPPQIYNAPPLQRTNLRLVQQGLVQRPMRVNRIQEMLHRDDQKDEKIHHVYENKSQSNQDRRTSQDELSQDATSQDELSQDTIQDELSQDASQDELSQDELSHGVSQERINFENVLLESFRAQVSIPGPS